MRPVKLIVPVVPSEIYTLEEQSALKMNGLSEFWMVEFVLAQWPTIHDYLETQDFNALHSYLDAELGDAIFANCENAEDLDPHQNFSQAYDSLYSAMMHTTEKLKPFIGRLDLSPDQTMVGVMNLSPFTREASVVNIHFENTEENWLHHSLLADAKV